MVWGEVIDKIKHKGYGLAHIIDKHPELDLKLISDIVDKGKLNNQNNIRYRIEYKNYIIGLSSEYKGNKRTFIITALKIQRIKTTLSPIVFLRLARTIY
ncbi:hypothetical protein [Campylobacter coli]|uniref:putative barnase/colicin E5 family endoribonuclease n=1 Tax=Campylobacter coli TaxID=195 RepID=UPI0020C74542|nr:hypothetical protein [Campylobacter coli]